MRRIKGIEKVTKAHLPLIKLWYQRRGMKMPRTGLLSTTGYIVDGRVAGWLHLTDSDIALIEGIIADPMSVPGLRRESLNKLSGYLIDTAILLGYNTVLAISKHPNIIQLSERYGFKELNGHKVMVLDASKD